MKTDVFPTDESGQFYAVSDIDSAMAALRAELAAAEADTIDATERVMLMRRDNQRAAAARRVAAYCRELRKRKVVSINKFELPPLEIDYGGDA